MILEPINIPPLDPNLNTAQVRFLSGPVRTGNVTLDKYYGEYARFIWVGVSGNLSIIKWDLTTQVYPNVPVGLWFFPSVCVNSSGTTASGLVWGS